MRISIVAAVLFAAGLAQAKPLPGGMKITTKDQKLLVAYRGVTVPLLDAETAAADLFSDLKGAELSADGKTILLHVSSCRVGEPDTPYEVSLASVEARVENALGMQLHVKKKYADAIAHFTLAAKGDPDTPMYATNLLSAQSMAKLYDEADKTLASSSPAHVPWFAWRLAVDPELATVRDRASAKALLAPAPSKLTVDALGEAVATNARGWFALGEWVFFGGPGAPRGGNLVIYDAKATVLLRLPIVALDDACYEKGEGPFAQDATCTKQNKAHTAAHKAEATRVLQVLGFEKQPTTWLDSVEGDQSKLASADKKITAAVTDQGIVITQGKMKTSVATMSLPIRVGVAGKLVILKYRENGFLDCDGDAQRSYSSFATIK